MRNMSFSYSILRICLFLLRLHPVWLLRSNKSNSPFLTARSASTVCLGLWPKKSASSRRTGVDLDMVYVGASAVIVQSMLSGSQCRRFWRSGRHHQRAARRRYHPGSRDGALPDPCLFVAIFAICAACRGKKIGITRFGCVTDFALRTIIERHNIKEVNVLQMGGFPERSPGCRAEQSTAQFFHRRTTSACSKKVFASWSRRRICARSGADFSLKGSSRGDHLPRATASLCAADQVHGRGHEIRGD